MKNTWIVGSLLLTTLTSYADPAKLIYQPQGDAIVIENGTRWDHRPLYCHERFAFVWSGEMPSLPPPFPRPPVLS